MADRPTFDRELDLRAIFYTGFGLAAILVVAAALMWPLSAGLRNLAAGADPAPPLLPEARERQLPPAPRLQQDPEGELTELRAAEEAALSTYGWLDDSRQHARIPIDRAIELLAGTEAASAAAGEDVPEEGSMGRSE